MEINTDENALRESIKAANRGELCAGIMLILLIPWLLRNELRYMKFYDGFYDMLLDGTALLTAAAVFMAVFYLVLGIYAILRSIAQRRRYLLDRSFRPGPEIHKRKLVRIALMTLVGISVMFLLVLGVGAAGNYYDVPLSNCPVVMLESLSPEEAAQLDYNADRLDAPHGTGGKSLLYSFATYRQDGPTIRLEGEYAGIGYSTFSYWVNVKDIRTESLAEKYFAEKEAAHDWQEVQIKSWALHRLEKLIIRLAYRFIRKIRIKRISINIVILRFVQDCCITLKHSHFSVFYKSINICHSSLAISIRFRLLIQIIFKIFPGCRIVDVIFWSLRLWFLNIIQAITLIRKSPDCIHRTIRRRSLPVVINMLIFIPVCIRARNYKSLDYSTLSNQINIVIVLCLLCTHNNQSRIICNNLCIFRICDLNMPALYTFIFNVLICLRNCKRKSFFRLLPFRLHRLRLRRKNNRRTRKQHCCTQQRT